VSPRVPSGGPGTGSPGTGGPGEGPAPRQLRPVEVKRLNREWRRATPTRLAVLLDSVGQPFNVGSIVRSAAAFGADQLWLCGSTAPLSHPGVSKTALGTQRLVPATVEPSPVAAAKAAAAAGLRVVAIELASGAVPLHEAPLDGDVCLAFGNEDHGCSAALLAVADVVAYIPQPGRVGSLNVAAAAAAAMAEVRRRAWTALASPPDTASSLDIAAAPDAAADPDSASGND
jgi:tRNA (guanosine-2'-O-)-methyltransferase